MSEGISFVIWKIWSCHEVGSFCSNGLILRSCLSCVSQKQFTCTCIISLFLGPVLWKILSKTSEYHIKILNRHVLCWCVKIMSPNLFKNISILYMVNIYSVWHAINNPPSVHKTVCLCLYTMFQIRSWILW